MSAKKEFGDFQTPLDLARQVTVLVDSLFGAPSRIIEPTAGLGAFLQAATETWGTAPAYRGYELNPAYVEAARSCLAGNNITITQQDFFQGDWRGILRPAGDEKVLVLGNPPWVTNAELGSLGSRNLPAKTNFQGLRGFDAKTGKSNFDIAEWMLIRLIEALPPSGAIAMLCKTMTARKVLRHFWKTDGGRDRTSLFLIDAASHFDASVDACLLFLRGREGIQKTAAVFDGLSLGERHSEFGLMDGHLVSDVPTYRNLRDLDGGSPYTWRSGLKHDAAEVMEFTIQNGRYVNGLGEAVELEGEFAYPLLKSSDLGNGRAVPRKAVLVTQTSTGQETSFIRHAAPRTWAYLQAHADKLDSRRSSIYQGRPRFSVFGIGPYSFAPWKVAISGLYHTFRFVAVGPLAGRPVMVDDTCYAVGCRSEDEACLIAELLNSDVCQRFLRSLVFPDTKRPVTVDVLRRISLSALARRVGRLSDLGAYLNAGAPSNEPGEPQLQLLMERGGPCRTACSCGVGPVEPSPTSGSNQRFPQGR